MTYVTGRSLRIGFVMLAATILSAGLSVDAFAKVHKAHWRAPSSVYDSRAQIISPQPARLGPMRYYGGPKSPMWRGPVEN
jgi:hypothetical protein